MNPIRVPLLLIAILVFTAPAGADFARVQRWIDKKGPVATIPNGCDGECVPSLALIRFFVTTPNSITDVTDGDQSCLGTLISADQILTNSHCVPEAELLRFTRVMFPRGPGHREVIRRVVRVDRRVPLTEDPLLDYAILRLDRAVDRPAIKMNARGLVTGEHVRKYAFRDRPGRRTSREVTLETQTCSVTRSAAGPEDARDVTLSLASAASNRVNPADRS